MIINSLECFNCLVALSMSGVFADFFKNNNRSALRNRELFSILRLKKLVFNVSITLFS